MLSGVLFAQYALDNNWHVRLCVCTLSLCGICICPGLALAEIFEPNRDEVVAWAVGVVSLRIAVPQVYHRLCLLMTVGFLF